jgi:hypothetical protein
VARLIGEACEKLGKIPGASEILEILQLNTTMGEKPLRI